MAYLSDRISDEELNSLTGAIRQKYGIDFTNYEVTSLKRGFARIISKHNLNSLIDLWNLIMKDKGFLFRCIDDLMVNLTELFRNHEVWNKIKDEIAPLYKEKELKVWHAGCSTGEEVYTMAIILHELGMVNNNYTLASDLSQTALNRAIEGRYPGVFFKKYLSAFKQYNPLGNFLNYIDMDGDDIIIKPELKEHVSFRNHNLVHDPMDEKFDIIFCRNVMIYFDDTLKKKVLKLFYDSLKPGGFFIIGYYDMLPEIHNDYFVLRDPITRIYKKIA